MRTRMGLSANECEEIRKIIEEKTGYYIKSTAILNQIFRRSSFAAATKQTDNEVFEFIGDQVLSYIIVKILSKRCASLSAMGDYSYRIQENRFTEIKQSLVNNQELSERTDAWDLSKFLLITHTDIKNDLLKITKVRADLFEAIIGGITVECDWDTEILENVVTKALDLDAKITAMIENDVKVQNINIDNAIQTLKELADDGGCAMPDYEFFDSAYQKNGVPLWKCTCSINNMGIEFSRTVTASSKKEAKKAATYLILCELLNMQNKYGPNSFLENWEYEDGKLSVI